VIPVAGRSSSLSRALVVAAALGAGFAAGAAADESSRYTRRVAVVVYDGVELLDFAGPGEVFEVAAGYGESAGRRAFEVYTVGRSREPITSQRFVEVVPQYGIAEAPLPDVLVIPGGSSGRVSGDAEFLAWVKRAAEGAEITLTVCTGAFVLGEAGLLDGREVTTWYNAVDRLQQRFPAVRAQHGRRFIDSGEVVTTAGVSAGIDGSLHVVARLLGRRVADATARYMEYHWAPQPYLARDYPDENPGLDERGRAVAAADAARDRGDWPAAAAAYRALTASDAEDGYSWINLGVSLHFGGDLAAAAAAYEKAAAFEAHRARALYNLACAQALQGEREAALTSLEGAAGAGFGDGGYLATDEDLASLREEPRFQALVERLR
jgi:putative intracellular protease/amidase